MAYKRLTRADWKGLDRKDYYIKTIEDCMSFHDIYERLAVLEDGIVGGYLGMKEKKCDGGGVTIYPDGVNELDPCIYEITERHTNCTVEVLKCKHCGHIDIIWVDNEKCPNAAEEECI